MSNTEDRERWQRVKIVLAVALELPSDQRSAFLDESCGKDLDLRREVESLLAFQQSTDTQKSQSSLQQPNSFPERIGAYKVIKEIGHGGMGTVYEAERADEAYKKRVAIKLIRIEGEGSESLQQRFRNERQILASLEHPNIARLLDGGTTETGTPFLVMEYVEGLPIHSYCEKNQLLAEERIELFRKLCSAVQYAHQHLIIHRDLKPGNILVTAEGVPKLLDFGIARLLQDGTGSNSATAPTRIMTPEYASPEQIKGEVITTATDVYSLGVVLYELLTGRSPYRSTSGGIAEIVREVCESIPEKPSTAAKSNNKNSTGSTFKLSKKLYGDIDIIVLKALSKEPEQRYQSVEQFSEDLRRHVEGRPILARQPTLFYRAHKFTSRHKATVIAAIIAIVALIFGLIEINRQRLRAEQRFNDVRKLAHSFVFEYHDAIADLPGSTPVRQKLVKDALAYLDSLARESSQDASLQRELAAAYSKIADVQGNSNMANLGDLDGALGSYRKSFEIRKRLLIKNPDDLKLQQDVAQSYLGIGDILSNTGDVKESFANFQHAIELLESIQKKSGDDPALLMLLAEAYSGAGDVKGNPFRPNLGDLSQGLDLHRKALATLLKLKTPDAKAKVDILEEHRTIAGLLTSSGNLNDAEQHARTAVTMANELVNKEHGTREKKALGNAREVLARILLTRERWDEALVVYKEIAAADEEMVKADPKDMQVLGYLAMDFVQIGHIFNNQKKFPEALEHYSKALTIDQNISALDPTNNVVRYGVSIDYLSIADALTNSGNLQGALNNQEQAVKLQKEIVQQNKDDLQAILNLAYAQDQLSLTYASLGNHRKAIEGFTSGIEAGEKALKQDAQNHRARRQLALRYLGLADSKIASAQWQDARKAYQRSLELLTELNKIGVLPPKYAEKLTDIPKKITKCDEALKP
jgi:eukaryotic-like serine/threonine-protein kinase